MNRRLRIILVLLFYALMFTYASVNAYQSLRLLRSYPGWQFRPNENRILIRAVSTNDLKGAALNGTTPDLRSDDEIVSLNGHPILSVSPASIMGSAPGSPYTMVVRRDGQIYEYNLRTLPVPLSFRLEIFALVVLLPVIMLFTGLAVFLLKPFDKQALLLALTFGVFIPPMAFHWFEGLPALLAAVMYLGPLITSLAFFFVLHFFLIFPEPSPILRRFPKLEWLLYLPYPTFFLWRNLSAATPWGVSQTFVPLGYLTLFFLALNFGGAVLSLVLNYRRANETAKRKMRVVVAGTIMGLLPGVLVFFILAPWVDFSKINPALGEWLPVVAALCFPLVPLSFAYAIVRHQVIPISLIIRRSVQYLLAKNAMRLLLALPVVGILLTIFSNPNRTLTEILFRNSVYFYLLVLIAIAFGRLFRKRLSGWIDRKFFRESYDQEKILSELIDETKRLDSISEMSKRVTAQVGAALHPLSIYLFYRDEERRALSLSYTSSGHTEELRIPEESRLRRFMEDQGTAQDFPFPQKNNLPQSEKDWLAQLGTRLIVPMTGTDERLAGLLLLGEKKSEVPYTTSDRNLLETLADQIAIVYENVSLKNRVERERKIKHEVLARVDRQNFNLLKECSACGACYDSDTQFCAKDRSELTLSLPVERTIEGRYRLERLLGKGGMGAVYEALDLRLNRRVAVKILTGSMFGNRDALRRFEREAQASARLSHPNIIAVHDYGTLSTEGAYIVMELAQGETLGARLKRERRITTRVAAELFNQTLEALGSAHAAGVVHRDLKPENLFIARGENEQETVKVLDFGLAKITQTFVAGTDDSTAVTTPGTVMGTFGYMSPEQLTGGSVDERSDLFSIGVMVVEAVTGSRPFAGNTYQELLHNILQKPFHLPADSVESQRLDAVLQRCLATDRALRFASAAEMRRELIPAISNCASVSFAPSAGSDAETIILN